MLPPVKFKKPLLEEIAAIVGEDNCSITDIDRFNYSRDANFRSTIQAHYSRFENIPSVIVWPASDKETAALVKLAIKNKIPLTPFGGGSGVCGGALSAKGGMIVDTKRMQKVLKIDREKLTVEAEAGILGMELQKNLARQGFTLGHFPSSILNACLGGFLATRSAGQFASKYGKIEDMVIDLEFVDGQGRIIQTSDVSRVPGTDLTQIIVGTEGTLGIITKARLKIYPQPQSRIFRAFTFDGIEYGIEAIRRIMQAGIKPDTLRLFDELETALVLSKISRKALNEETLSDTLPELLVNALKTIKSSAFHLVFKSHRLINEFFKYSWRRCALIVVLEGHEKLIEEQLKIISNICDDINADDIGDDIAMHWHDQRYSVSFEGASLFQDGAFFDTMEVATTWDNLMHLYDGIKKSLKSQCFVLGHIAHTYEEGAAIYFTLISPLNGLKQSVKKYDKIWDIALNAAQKYGGILSHHHGIGRLKKKYMVSEWGEAAELYKKLKENFDPEGIMNPDVLL